MEELNSVDKSTSESEVNQPITSVNETSVVGESTNETPTNAMPIVSEPSEMPATFVTEQPMTTPVVNESVAEGEGKKINGNWILWSIIAVIVLAVIWLLLG